MHPEKASAFGKGRSLQFSLWVQATAARDGHLKEPQCFRVLVILLSELGAGAYRVPLSLKCLR